MRIPDLPSLPKMDNRALYRVLSALIGVVRIRFYGSLDRGEQVALKKDLFTAISEIETGKSGTVSAVADVRLVDDVLEKKMLTMDVKAGRIVKASESEWGV